jgi:RNA polymerase sigma-70 factor (ECF subfamily)
LENIARIIKGCVNKEPKYQRLVYDRYRHFASRIVFRYIYRYEKAMDIVTDGFVKAFLHFERFTYSTEADAEKQLMGWLKKIMINCAIDELRRANLLPEIGEISEEVWNLSAKNEEADQLLLYKDLISVIRELPPTYRLIVNLYILDGYNHSQIADLMKISVSTSRANLTRARSYLKDAVKKMEDEKECRI